MSTQTPIDQADLRILSALQDNASLSNSEIAQLVGLSTPSCLRRIKCLKNNGFLTGSHSCVNGALLNLDLIIYCDVTLEKHSHNNLIHFQESMNRLSCVRECHMVTGASDFLLKIITHNMKTYTYFLTQHLAPSNNISKVQSRMLVQTSKKVAGIPIECLLTI